MAKKMATAAKQGRVVTAKVPSSSRAVAVKKATSKVKAKVALSNRELTRS